jgi:hypothetical protein
LSRKTDTSRFAKRLNENGHSFGPIEDIMETLKSQTKGIHLNTVERLYIRKKSITNNHLNDPQTLAPTESLTYLQITTYRNKTSHPTPTPPNRLPKDTPPGQKYQHTIDYAFPSTEAQGGSHEKYS